MNAPIKTVPFLGKGNVDVYQENKIRLGDTFKEKKSVSQFNEQPFQDIANYPMQEDVKKITKRKNRSGCESFMDAWWNGYTYFVSKCRLL